MGGLALKLAQLIGISKLTGAGEARLVCRQLCNGLQPSLDIGVFSRLDA